MTAPACVFYHPILLLFLVCGLLQPLTESSAASRESGRWWKGNLHTHTFWSDGDDFPESIVDWYRTNGYHFLALSDHNVQQSGERWMAVTNEARRIAWEKY